MAQAKKAVEKKPAGERKKKVTTRLVPAATRTIAILRLLAKNEQPLSLKQISSELDIVPSTCLHILRVLVAEALVSVDEGAKRYQLGIGVLTFAGKAMGLDRLLGHLQQETEAISREFNVCVIASKVDGDRLYVIAVAMPRNAFTIHAQVGSRYPIYMGAAGVCHAAFSGQNPRQVFQRLKQGRWAREPRQAEWLAEVEKCKERGFAVDRENYVDGMTMITAPVFSQEGAITHTIGAVVLSQTADKLGIDTIGKALLAAAGKVRSFN